MGVELKPLTDTVSVVEKVGNGVLALEEIPGKERQRYRDAVYETLDVLHQAVSLIINRLGDLTVLDMSKSNDRQKLAEDLAKLDNIHEWLELERRVHLCGSLREAGREMKGLRDRLQGRIALEDWKEFRALVQNLLVGESDFALKLSNSLLHLAQRSQQASHSVEGALAAQEEVKKTRDDLREVRSDLIKKQGELLDTI